MSDSCPYVGPDLGEFSQSREDDEESRQNRRERRELVVDPVWERPALTARELQVLKLIAEGCATKEVATHLQISLKTADSHRTRLMGKLDLHCVADLVRYAIKVGLVTV